MAGAGSLALEFEPGGRGASVDLRIGLEGAAYIRIR
jgi:hypothetical protein